MPNHSLLTTQSFELSIPGVSTIGYFSECSGLELYFDVDERREGGNNDVVHRLPGQLHYPNLVLTSGLTTDGALFDWFWATRTQAERQEVALTLHNSTGTRSWMLADAFPVRWSGPQLAAGSGEVATETLEIAHGGLTPDRETPSPQGSQGAQGFQRATLEIAGSPPIKCAFNPSSYTVSKTNVWNLKPTTGIDVPASEFGGGLPQRVTLSLLLDDSLAGPDRSVGDQASQLLKMMKAEAAPGAGQSPARIIFRWGSVAMPESVPVSLSVQYVLFRPDGVPTRATVDLELLEAEQERKGQNPTTQALIGLHVHKVRDGDSLPAIAQDAYGDPTRWRVIADANGIDNPFRLRRGAELTIPRLEA